MKKIIAAISVASLLLVGACTGSKKHSDDTGIVRELTFESYTFDCIGEYFGSDTLDVEDGRLTRYVAQGVLPTDIDNTNIHALRDSLLAIAGVQFIDDTPQPVFRDSIRLSELSPRDTTACGYANSSLSVTLVTPTVVVWKSYRESLPCMAAHSVNATSYINYCMTDGRIVSLDIMFIANYRKPLTKLIRDKLKTMDIDLLVPLKEVEIPAQFEIAPGGINFSFDPYDIAPYSDGTIKVEITLADLDPLLSDHGRLILGLQPE